jgi:pre-mRNA-splicing factor RBM22/SLT11
VELFRFGFGLILWLLRVYGFL